MTCVGSGVPRTSSGPGCVSGSVCKGFFLKNLLWYSFSYHHYLIIIIILILTVIVLIIITLPSLSSFLSLFPFFFFIAVATKNVPAQTLLGKVRVEVQKVLITHGVLRFSNVRSNPLQESGCRVSKTKAFAIFLSGAPILGKTGVECQRD